MEQTLVEQQSQDMAMAAAALQRLSEDKVALQNRLARLEYQVSLSQVPFIVYFYNQSLCVCVCVCVCVTVCFDNVHVCSGSSKECVPSGL